MDENTVNNMPEKIRQRIDEVINEAAMNKSMPPNLKYMLTNICYLMYTSGYKDGCRACELAIKAMADMVKGY